MGLDGRAAGWEAWGDAYLWGCLLGRSPGGPRSSCAGFAPWACAPTPCPPPARPPALLCPPQAYLLYHPDLRSLGVTSEAGARKHYLERGRAEGRVYKRIRVLLRYTACTGLINQHYSHIAAFSLAAMLGAELVLPPAVCRDSFAHYFSVFKEKNEVQWSPVPLDSLLDVEGIISYWRPRGLVLHKVGGAGRGGAAGGGRQRRAGAGAGGRQGTSAGGALRAGDAGAWPERSWQRWG